MGRKSKKQLEAQTTQVQMTQPEVQMTQPDVQVQEPQQYPEPQMTQQPVLQQYQEVEKDDDSIIEAPKSKRKVSQKTLDALARGREKLKEKWSNDKIKNDELKEVYAIKKVNKIIKQKLKIKENIGVDQEEDDEPEHPIKLVQPIKKKKQQIITLPLISDDEEEIIIKKPSKAKKEVSVPTPQPSDKPKLIFF
jgi:hypothetical protein